MFRPCDVCGVSYEAKRPNSRFCSGTCRKRFSRGVVTLPEVTERETAPVTKGDVHPLASLVPSVDLEVGPVETALLSELTEVERAATALGQAALALARRVDIGRDTGAGLASLVKQLEATVKAATADVKSDQSVLDKRRDDLAARRAARGA
jgi:hypothetical protein